MSKKDLTTIEFERIESVLSKNVLEQKIESIAIILNNVYHFGINDNKSHRQLLQEILNYSFSCNDTYVDYIHNNLNRGKSCNIYYFKDDICIIECYSDYNNLNINRFIRRIDENSDKEYIFFIKNINDPFDIFNMRHLQYSFS